MAWYDSSKKVELEYVPEYNPARKQTGHEVEIDGFSYRGEALAAPKLEPFIDVGNSDAIWGVYPAPGMPFIDDDRDYLKNTLVQEIPGLVFDNKANSRETQINPYQDPGVFFQFPKSYSEEIAVGNNPVDYRTALLKHLSNDDLIDANENQDEKKAVINFLKGVIDFDFYFKNTYVSDEKKEALNQQLSEMLSRTTFVAEYTKGGDKFPVSIRAVTCSLDIDGRIDRKKPINVTKVYDVTDNNRNIQNDFLYYNLNPNSKNQTGDAPGANNPFLSRF